MVQNPQQDAKVNAGKYNCSKLSMFQSRETVSSSFKLCNFDLNSSLLVHQETQ